LVKLAGLTLDMDHQSLPIYPNYERIIELSAFQKPRSEILPEMQLVFPIQFEADSPPLEFGLKILVAG